MGDDIGEFHQRGGWTFQRQSDGAVRIRKYTHAGRTTVEVEHVIPDNEWASVIAWVSAEGENAETWSVARQFHGLHAFAGSVLTALRYWQAAGQPAPADTEPESRA